MNNNSNSNNKLKKLNDKKSSRNNPNKNDQYRKRTTKKGTKKKSGSFNDEMKVLVEGWQKTKKSDKAKAKDTKSNETKKVEDQEAKLERKRKMKSERPKNKKAKTEEEIELKIKKQEEEDAKVTLDKKDAALLYLEAWHNDRDNWKFQKVRQVFLIQNVYSNSLVPKPQFKLLLPYLDGIKGKAREDLLQEAKTIFESLVEKERGIAARNVNIDSQDKLSPEIKDGEKRPELEELSKKERIKKFRAKRLVELLT